MEQPSPLLVCLDADQRTLMPNVEGYEPGEMADNPGQRVWEHTTHMCYALQEKS